MSLFDPIPKFPKKLVTTQRNLLRNAHCHILGNVGIYWDIEIICKHASKLLKLNTSGNPSESECPSPHSSGPPCHVAGGIWLRRSSPQREREREREREKGEQNLEITNYNIPSPRYVLKHVWNRSCTFMQVSWDNTSLKFSSSGKQTCCLQTRVKPKKIWPSISMH